MLRGSRVVLSGLEGNYFFIWKSSLRLWSNCPIRSQKVRKKRGARIYWLVHMCVRVAPLYVPLEFLAGLYRWILCGKNHWHVFVHPDGALRFGWKLQRNEKGTRGETALNGKNPKNPCDHWRVANTPWDMSSLCWGIGVYPVVTFLGTVRSWPKYK